MDRLRYLSAYMDVHGLIEDESAVSAEIAVELARMAVTVGELRICLDELSFGRLFSKLINRYRSKYNIILAACSYDILHHCTLSIPRKHGFI